jgi:hypothetical protein
MNMNVVVKKAVPLADYLVELHYSDGTVRMFDAKSLLNTGVFKELSDVNMFRTVRVSFDTITWANEADIDPEYLFEASVRVEETAGVE